MPTLSYAKLVFQLEERHLTLHLVPCQFFTHVKGLKMGHNQDLESAQGRLLIGNAPIWAITYHKTPPTFSM